MKPATKAPSNSLQLRLSPVGTLVRVVGRIPQRTKVLGVLGLSALGVGSATILATIATPPETTLEGNRSAAYDFVSGDPALMAGVSPTDLPEDALAKIFLVMPSFDAWLADQIDSDIGALLTSESLRLAEAAQKEASEGEIETADPVADIDLKGCLQQITAAQCVLLRYAADGLKTYHEAADQGDVYGAMGGVLRYRAALAALYPVEQRQPQTQLTLKGLKNYRLSMFDIARLLPASLGPTVEFRAPLGDTSPASAVEQGARD